MKRTIYVISGVLLALGGLIDSAYLTDMAFKGAALTCDIAGLNGCNVVAQSVYSRVFGLPLALYGVVFYLLFLIAFFAYEKFKTPFLRQFLFVVSAVGVVFSIYFLYLQVAVIKAVCVYCLGSAIAAFLLAFLVVINNRKTAVLPPAEGLV